MAVKKRLKSQESRAVALEAARVLLLESGPQGVTLKAVAGRIGRTHANLLHHFGSAAGLQQALAGYLAQAVCDAISESVCAKRTGIGHPREVVDLTFDAFSKLGGGALASWMLAAGNDDALDPIVATIHELVDDLKPRESRGRAAYSGAGREIHELTLTLVLLALGDSLLGEPLAQSVGVRRSAPRDRAEKMLISALAPREVQPA